MTYIIGLAYRHTLLLLLLLLLFRCEDAADMKNLEQSGVEAIASDIEEKLFNLHQDINPKYKNKYRSLVFNLKDTKNQVSEWLSLSLSTCLHVVSNELCVACT